MEHQAGEYHVYIMRSIDHPGKFHVGYTADLDRRMEQHNNGRCFETSENYPWELVWFAQFRDKSKAVNFEKYLKTKPGIELYRNRLV